MSVKFLNVLHAMLLRVGLTLYHITTRIAYVQTKSEAFSEFVK